MQLPILIVLFIGSTLAIPGIINNNNNANNYQFGQIGTGTIISSGTVNANFRFGQVITQDFVYTAPAANAPVILAIIITDLKRRRGATAAIVSGGVGQTSVTIRFTSQRGTGISSRVDIYG